VTRDERGQVTVLIVGFATVAALMVGVVVDASAAYLRRQNLDAVADGAALAAADGIQGEQVYENGLGERARIDPVAARRYVADYLRATGAASRFPGLACLVRAEDERIVVRVSAPLDLPIDPPGWAHRPVVAATASSVVLVSP
jgi:hypothetical protein